MDAFPNPHPMLVHFPIALLPAAMLVDLVASLTRRDPAADRGAAALQGCAALLHALAALGALVAWLSGRAAAEDAGDVRGAAQLALGDHGDAGLAALFALALLATARAIAAWRAVRGRRSISAALFVALALPPFALVLRTANLGGALVYRHGIGVSAAPLGGATPAPRGGALESDPAAPPPVATPLRETTSGGVTWSPTASDTGFLGTVLLQVPESAPVTAVRGPGSGLALRVDGRSVLLLPGAYGDATLEARVERSQFEGTIGLVMRSRFPADATLFELGSSGATLAAVRSGAVEVLGRGAPSAGGGLVTLALTAEGSRLRGAIDGKTIATGDHAAPAGSAGILLDGTGVVRIRAIEVKPIDR